MSTPSPLELTQLRMGLLAAGYVPLPAMGKAVRLPGWNTLHVDAERIPSWEYQPTWTNTGLRCRETPALDIDIAQAKAAEAIEALARERFGEHGRVLSRIGKAPKRAVPFRTSTPFRKIKVELIAPDGSKGAVEFLGDGQQFITAGTHPDTNAPYVWQDGEQPGAVRLNELPEINQQAAEQFIDDAVELLETEHGFKRAAAAQVASERTEFEPTATLVPDVHPVVVEEYQDYFAVIDPDIDYDEWFKLCCALFHTLGPETGKQVAIEWSARGKKFKRGELDSKWKGINAKSAYGYGRQTILNAWALADEARMSEQEREQWRQSIAELVETRRRGRSCARANCCNQAISL